MTANAMAGDRERSLAAGMNDHVTKPIDPDELFEVLLRWLPERPERFPAPLEPITGTGEDSPVSDRQRDWLFQIPSLDAADGLRRVLGRREAYVSLLRRFASSQADVLGEIRRAFAENRHGDAERAAHTLKGIAGTIGARQLQEEARVVEASLHNGALPQGLEPLLRPAEQTLKQLVSALQASLPAEVTSAPPAVADQPALHAALKQLDELLSQDAMEAVDVYDEAAPLLTAAFGARAEEFGKLVRDYNFEDALATLRGFAAGS